MSVIRTRVFGIGTNAFLDAAFTIHEGEALGISLPQEFIRNLNRTMSPVLRIDMMPEPEPVMRAEHSSLDTSMRSSLKSVMESMLALILTEIGETDPSKDLQKPHESHELPCECEQRYAKRNGLIYQAMAYASMVGYPVGFTASPIHPDDWPVAYIELPTGQVSWHLPPHPVPYDGHTTPAKYERIDAYQAKVDADNA